MAYGVTPEGFVIKRLQDILTAQRAKAVQLFQDLVPEGEVVDTSTDTLLGRLVALDSDGDASLWEAAQGCYSAFDPNAATGVPLRNLVALGGIVVEGALPTTSYVLLTGDTGTTVQADSQVSSSSSSATFTLDTLVEISAKSASSIVISVASVQDNTTYTVSYTSTTTTQTISYTTGTGATVSEILTGLEAAVSSGHPSLYAEVGTTTIEIGKSDVFSVVDYATTANLGITKATKIGQVTCTETGVIEQLAGTIDTIDTPVLGWDSVTNPSDATTGQEEETDEELRERFRVSKFERATNIIESLYSALLNVSGVEQVIIYPNDTDTTDSNGVPPHSFLPIVVGGQAAAIGKAIWENKPLGILSYGNTTVAVTDSQGFAHDVSYEIPNPIVIHIEMTLTTNSNYPSGGDDLIRDALITYFQDNLSIGDDVVYSRLYTPINSVAGHQVESLYIGLTTSPSGMVNVPIAFNEIASLSDVNIVINT